MPPRRKYRRRRPPPSRRQIYGAAGKQLYKDVRHLKRLINVEFKFHDVQLTTATVDEVPLITQLSNIAIGDTTNTRDGSQVKCLSLQIAFWMNSSASASASLVRVLLVKDKQTNQAIYTAADLLSDVTTSDSIVSPYNRDNRLRFTVLMDKVFTLSTAGNNRNRVFGRKFRQDQVLRYDAAAGDITDLTQSSYSIVFISNEPTNSPNVTLFSRLNYVDN